MNSLIWETNVLLPHRIFDEAGNDKELFKKLVLEYMNVSYPHYRVLKVKGKFAVCERK